MGFDRPKSLDLKDYGIKVVFFREKVVSQALRTVRFVIRPTSSFAAIRGEAASSPERCSRTSLRPIVVGFPPELRRLRCCVVSETLASGTPVSLAGVTIALYAHATLADTPLVWTRDHVETLLWFGLKQCASDLEIDLPSDAARALHAVLACCAEGEFHDPKSERISELFSPLQELASL